MKTVFALIQIIAFANASLWPFGSSSEAQQPLCETEPFKDLYGVIKFFLPEEDDMTHTINKTIHAYREATPVAILLRHVECAKALVKAQMVNGEVLALYQRQVDVSEALLAACDGTEPKEEGDPFEGLVATTLHHVSLRFWEYSAAYERLAVVEGEACSANNAVREECSSLDAKLQTMMPAGKSEFGARKASKDGSTHKMTAEL